MATARISADPAPDRAFFRTARGFRDRSGHPPGWLTAGLLDPQLGHAVRAPAGPARAQPGLTAPAGRAQPTLPGGVRQQLGDATAARNGDDGPDPAAGERKPLPRPTFRRIGWHGTHMTPSSPTASLRGAVSLSG